MGKEMLQRFEDSLKDPWQAARDIWSGFEENPTSRIDRFTLKLRYVRNPIEVIEKIIKELDSFDDQLIQTLLDTTRSTTYPQVGNNQPTNDGDSTSTQPQDNATLPTENKPSTTLNETSETTRYPQILFVRMFQQVANARLELARNLLLCLAFLLQLRNQVFQYHHSWFWLK
jgi:hypothetical protein